MEWVSAGWLPFEVILNFHSLNFIELINNSVAKFQLEELLCEELDFSTCLPVFQFNHAVAGQQGVPL
ncbi:hypothetical protein LMG29542_08629 [Paraburkholderia humisilvae]|uniref:Uncharacterized protein n=1 Tax=Paraburkholderia humisilvae TaxID=627669 RepID=A0A6J5FCR4_9BURK|nr:hypothetical protein LMG29542_08629 [Paraburkholderia humisilvae]